MLSNQENLGGPLIVGFIPHQHPEVLACATDLAHHLGAPIVFAYVKPDSYLTEWDFSKNIINRSLHPDDLDEENTIDALTLLETIEAHMVGRDVSWRLRILAGEPWRALSRLADESCASMLIIGTRRTSVSSRISVLVGESTGAHLAAYQQRPLLIVPPAHKRHDH